MKYLILFIQLLFTVISFSQTKKDTVYILFDKTETGMKKGLFIDNNIICKERKESIKYFINEKKTENPQLVDTGYTFWHRNRSKRDYEKWGGKPPIIKKKNISFLQTIKLLDINFFLTTDYNDVCKTFEAEDSWEQDVIIFMIDKDEIKNGKMTMREVTFSRPVKE